MKDPSPNFILFQLRRKPTSRRSQATLQSHHHPPSPSLLLPFPSLRIHRSSRTLMLPSLHDPSPTALHRPRSTMLLVIAPFQTTRRTLRLILETSMQIPVNCGYRDLRQCFPHGSFVDHFLRRRLFGLSKERGRERGSSESRFCRSGYVSVYTCGEQVCHFCNRLW